MSAASSCVRTASVQESSHPAARMPVLSRIRRRVGFDSLFMTMAKRQSRKSPDVRLEPEMGRIMDVSFQSMGARLVLEMHLAERYASTIKVDWARRDHRLHFIEHPIEGVCSPGPWPVSATCFIASKRSRRAFATGVMREPSSLPRYCSSSCALKPKKSGVHCAS